MNIGYARVSSYDQKRDLHTQIRVLQQFADKKQIPMFSIMSDLGSGLNFKKKGLNQLISMILSSQIDTIYLTHKDRLLRFGNELIVMIAKQFNTKVVILHQQEEGFRVDNGGGSVCFQKTISGTMYIERLFFIIPMIFVFLSY